MTFERKLKLIDCTADAPAATVRVAFASADRKHVDQHFGAASGFVVYTIESTGYELESVAQFGRLDMDGNEDKLDAKIEALSGCLAVYCQAVGASAIQRLRANGIQPIKVPPGTSIGSLLSELQRELETGPSAWLARAIARQAPPSRDRFEAMEHEGWQE